MSATHAPRAATARPMAPPAGLELVAVRRLLAPSPEVVVGMRPGDRALVAAGDTVHPGTVLVEQLRDARLVEVQGSASLRPGDRWRAESRNGPRSDDDAATAVGRRGRGSPEGELLFETGGRWRVAAGDHHEPVESPLAGIVREVRAGQAIRLQAGGTALTGILALGSLSRGRLQVATDADGELLPRALDVSAAGAVLVVGARIDAEALTRARAMGVRGIVVASLPSKDRRDFQASEARQRAALHRLPPFGVLVLHGASRRPIASPVMELLERLAGRDVAVVRDPPALVIDGDDVALSAASPDAVHVRSGPLAGRSGRWAGLAGTRRFAGGTHLEAGFVRFGDDPPVALPLADLERYA